MSDEIFGRHDSFTVAGKTVRRGQSKLAGIEDTPTSMRERCIQLACISAHGYGCDQVCGICGFCAEGPDAKPRACRRRIKYRAVLDTILAEIQEPSEEMLSALTALFGHNREHTAAFQRAMIQHIRDGGS